MIAFDYHAPESLQEAVRLLDQFAGTARVVAGGTDLMVNCRLRGVGPQHVISLRRLENLNTIRTDEATGRVRIGAFATLRQIERSPLLRERCAGLVEAAHKVGSIPVRNLATIGGNLCNASPSAETAPPLLAAAATVTLTGPAGQRTIPLEQFFLGPGKTVLRPNEVLTEVSLLADGAGAASTYERQCIRRFKDIALVGAGARLALDGEGRCRAVGLALGAVAPTPLPVPAAADLLLGQEPSDARIAEVAVAARAAARPITDIRASAEYRSAMVEVLTIRVLRALREALRN